MESFSHTKAEEIEQIIIDKIKINKATGSDGIPARVLVDSKILVLKIMVNIINNHFDMGTFPDAAKHVYPVFKGGDRRIVSNHRPIAVLPAPSKIMEQVIKKRLSTYTRSHNLINPNQYGFRENSDTSCATIDLINKIRTKIDEGFFVCGVFLDLTKAFDTVSHSILEHKLEDIGIGGKALDVLKDFLRNRSQQVVIGNVRSSKLLCKKGVPQGSILSPTLYNIFTNDIKTLELILNGELSCYADDTALFVYAKDSNTLVTRTNHDLDILASYFQNNKLLINSSKTKVMVFTSTKRKFSSSLNFTIEAEILPIENQVKYLGLYLDRFLKWTNHVKHVALKIAPYVSVMYRLKKHLHIESLLKLYYAFIHSHISYLNVVWGSGYMQIAL